MTIKKIKEAAKQIGAKSFVSGESRTPAWSKDLVELLKEFQSFSKEDTKIRIEAAKCFLMGWDLENNKA